MQKTFNSKNNSTKLFRIKHNIPNIKNKHEEFDKYLGLRKNIFSDQKFDIKQYLDNAKNNYIFHSLDKTEKNLSINSTDNITKQNSFGSKSFGMNLSMYNNKASKLNLPSLSMNMSNYSNSYIYKPKTKYIGSKKNYNLSS